MGGGRKGFCFDEDCCLTTCQCSGASNSSWAAMPLHRIGRSRSRRRPIVAWPSMCKVGGENLAQSLMHQDVSLTSRAPIVADFPSPAKVPEHLAESNKSRKNMPRKQILDINQRLYNKLCPEVGREPSREETVMTHISPPHPRLPQVKARKREEERQKQLDANRERAKQYAEELRRRGLRKKGKM